MRRRLFSGTTALISLKAITWSKTARAINVHSDWSYLPRIPVRKPLKLLESPQRQLSSRFSLNSGFLLGILQNLHDSSGIQTVYHNSIWSLAWKHQVAAILHKKSILTRVRLNIEKSPSLPSSSLKVLAWWFCLQGHHHGLTDEWLNRIQAQFKNGRETFGFVLQIYANHMLQSTT